MQLGWLNSPVDLSSFLGGRQGLRSRGGTLFQSDQLSSSCHSVHSLKALGTACTWNKSNIPVEKDKCRDFPDGPVVKNLSAREGTEVWSELVLVVKNPPAIAGDVRDAASIPGSGRSPGGGHSDPLQYSCLENPINGGAWQAMVHGVTESQTQLRRPSTRSRDPVC